MTCKRSVTRHRGQILSVLIGGSTERLAHGSVLPMSAAETPSANTGAIAAVRNALARNRIDFMRMVGRNAATARIAACVAQIEGRASTGDVAQAKGILRVA